VVVRARAEIPALVRGGGDTVGVRAPRHTLFAELVARVHALGGPPGLAGTSANLHGETPPTDAGAARACFPEHEIAVLDGGPCELGVESTVLLATGEHPKILRSGAYSQASLSELAGREVELASGIDALTRAPAITWRLADEHTLRTLVPDPHVGVLARLPAREGFGATWISLPEDHTAFARELYRAIARLEASGARQIFVHACGGTGIGAAIDERVRRRS
jgi:L-threonylcarbamoyladenylate synthase